MTLALQDIDETFVVARRDALVARAEDRNSRMDDYLELYKLDVWEGEARPGERRVASPRAFTVVEAYRTLLFTRPPVLHVEPSQVKSVLQTQAELMEKFLYGVWDQTHLMNVIDDVEFWACAVGRGVFKVLYQPDAPYDELPLMAQAIDPRNFYHYPSAFRPGEDIEVAHSFYRTRRDIEQDWGEIPDSTRPDDAQALEEWLDEDVEYTDYWRTILVEEELEEEEAEPLLPMARVANALRGLIRPQAVEEEEKVPEKVLRRKVINCVLAGDDFVKEPAIVPGYERLPFFYWDGIHTPMSGRDNALSVLYPIAGGERRSGTQGLLATENQVLALKVRLVEMYANAAAITNDESLSDLDMKPGAVNVAENPDYRLDWVMPPGVHPDADRLMAQMADLSEEATIPGSLLGRYQGEISGVAMSMLTNPVLMRIAARQRQREEVLQRMNKLVLALTEEWAPAGGWTVWGKDHRGRELEVRLRPGDIKGYRRNTVKLSASLPKDIQGELMLHSNLVKSKIESRYTAINKLQELTGELGRTPTEEINQILVESVLMDEDEPRKVLARRALQDFDAALAAQIQAAEQPSPQMALPGMGGQGPMQGIPPEVVPPEALGGGGPGGQITPFTTGQEGTEGGRPPLV